MAYHKVGKEDMNSLHNGGWDDLRLSIVPIEVQRSEDGKQH